ncbi:hypothetical protein [Almyronema epifaneia]|uniref:Uncharacterized protein n=1 Tax=Almyronema epifaneia S1 TaxID=2991925 RepID=A0ABW6IJZ7_9CYAN
MANCITAYLQTPSIQAAEAKWGNWFQELSESDRYQLIETLSYAAQELIRLGEVDLETIDNLFCRWQNPELSNLLTALDKELTDISQIAALINAIATGLQR